MSDIKININRAQIGQNRQEINKNILIELLLKLSPSLSDINKLKIVIFEDVSKFALYRLYKVSQEELKKKNYKKEAGLKREIDTGTEIGKWVKYWKKVDCDGPGFIAQYEYPPMKKRIALVIIDTEGTEGNLLINADDITNIYAVDSQPGSYFTMFRTQNECGANPIHTTFCLWSNDTEKAKSTFNILEYHVRNRKKEIEEVTMSSKSQRPSSKLSDSPATSTSSIMSSLKSKFGNNNFIPDSDGGSCYEDGSTREDIVVGNLGNSSPFGGNALTRLDSLSSEGGVNELDQIALLLKAVSPFQKDKAGSASVASEEDSYARLHSHTLESTSDTYKNQSVTLESSFWNQKLIFNNHDRDEEEEVPQGFFSDGIKGNLDRNRSNSVIRITPLSDLQLLPSQPIPNTNSISHASNTFSSESTTSLTHSTSGINLSPSVDSIFYGMNDASKHSPTSQPSPKVPVVVASHINNNTTSIPSPTSSSPSSSTTTTAATATTATTTTTTTATTTSSMASAVQASSQPLRKPSLKPTSVLKNIKK